MRKTLLKRALALVLMALLLAGCVTTYHDWYGERHGPLRSKVDFARDVTACGGSPEWRIYAFPLITAPLFYGAEIALEHARRRCMAARGWRVVEPPEPRPLGDHADGRLNEGSGNLR